MVPGLRPFLVVLCFGQAFAFWLMSGHFTRGDAPAADRKAGDRPAAFVTGDERPGKFWGNEGGKKVIDWDGDGVDGKGKAITIRFEGAGWRGCGFNWKGWYPADAATDASKFRSLVFHIRQVTKVPDADLTVHLVDNLKRDGDTPPGNGLSALRDGRLTRIDGEWRKVVLPLDKFVRGKALDLKRLWEIDFSDTSGKSLAFQIDQVGFSDDCAPCPSSRRAPATRRRRPYTSASPATRSAMRSMAPAS